MEGMLRFYNTLTRRKEIFRTIREKEVYCYSCGPTIYGYCHIGNFRSFIFADILRKYLKYKGYKIKQVMNLTDVDDKTIKRSREQNIPLNKFTSKYKNAFFEDLEKLNIEKVEVYSEATKHINEMVALVQKLLSKGYAYKSEDGSIYYSISKFKGYGKLSRLKIKKLKAGARVKQDEYEKTNVADFVLWKAWDKDDGNVFWVTKLCKGRPGWHIECSAMSMKYLGYNFDIHTGGIDLIFPHHENEIAQSEGATGKRFVNYWLHCAHLVVDGKKMSKSLGNFYTLRDLLDKGHDAKAIRYILLSTHYRQPLNFTFNGLESAKNAVARLQEFVDKLNLVKGPDINIHKILTKVEKDFEIAMDDDLNISNTLAVLFDFIRTINKFIDKDGIGKNNAKAILRLMKEFNSVLGVIDFKAKEILPQEILLLAKKREKLRAEKNFNEADKIRDILKEKGYIIEDTEDGFRIKKI